MESDITVYRRKERLHYSRTELKLKKTKELEKGKKQHVIGGKGLAGMSGSTLRSRMLLDQVGGWLGNKLQGKLF